ncbi:1-deoxyxylulose-5-phosphate synthase [Malaciobacter marinus]|uniref:1-deoxy-D-xylulose-5-phosphate synthase n=1 Tax=Malaciobacter marinus TaxID=505249 RepID=A0A347THK0_9BACT|nr:1-deoxy-D-xylulose-5-phosphate synthase [Malaciobacter marinus]AXX86078.1 1-deoxyxylulose-5-phosphate synthase [Malaciobacter marinus]PHO14337.1 1-deoxy-D-xylulose-5-phosphate synthase [Malaciobacter marinus]
MNVKSRDLGELEELCTQIRERIIDVVSRNGGHFSSTLGAVELTVAMHKVFDVQNDPFIFDVSHQCYPHKLLTSRWEKFETIRQFGGLSGFTKPKESSADYFVAGHSSTSISLAVGAAKAIKINDEQRVPVVMIGDGSMTAGMVYEALNELGDIKLPVIIILNDNEMSIAKPIGSISKYLSKILAGKFYQKLRDRIDKSIIQKLPEGANYIAKKIEESIKLITPGVIFEEMGIDYIGPIDGHNLEEIIDTLQIAKDLKKPVIVHAKTVKGKGYAIAEGQNEKWHGVGPFDVKTGEFKKKAGPKSATAVYADALSALANEHDDVVGVTAAMPSGTGIDRLMQEHPNRFWDIAIAEQHAVTSMAAMAKEGFKPYITIYSTFLQRAYDQIIHDVCIMGLPVVFAIDRAGIVGNDGETHQGAFDISYLRFLPNMILFAPRDNQSLHQAINFSYTLDKPCAIRYPRGAFKELGYESTPFELGKSQLLKDGSSNKLFIGYGAGVSRACETEKLHNEDIAILDLRFVKPLDGKMLSALASKYDKWYVFSDSQKQSGVASAILEYVNEARLCVNITSFEYEDHFIVHGETSKVEESLELTAKQLVEKI